MSDTFFTASPHWRWLIILYFFVGGIAGGSYFVAALLEWFGRRDDRPVIRTGYALGFWGAIISGALLTLDLGRPLRFWHMLFQSENFPNVMFKSWSPISFGAWAILSFGACAAVSMISVRSEDRQVRAPTLFAKLIAGLGGIFGFFVAGYTGVLLSVTNRPIWADSPWLGALFLASGASTGAAALMLFARRRGASESSIRWLAAFDARALIAELLILIVFVASVWPIRQVWIGFWGLLLLVGVVGAGILWPLRLHFTSAGTGFRNPAVMVLLGGFLLRVVVLFASNAIAVHRVASGG
jgi:formate-dependent nitrite reductase membrane component NrfD